MPTADGRVGFGVVGVNFGLGRCAVIQKTPEAQLVAVAARSEQSARPAGEQLGVDWHTDYREMLQRDDVDVIAIFTPNASHADIAIEAARAGKHVLTTKPLEITTERVDTVIEACRAAGVKLSTEYMSRYVPENYLGYRAIADGALGKPVLGEFAYKCYRPQEYYTGTRGTWAVDGGGAILLQAIHTIDLMLWYLGDVQSIVAKCGTFTHRMETEDTGVALVTFVSGALATLVGTTTFHNPLPPGQYGGGSLTRMEVGGSDGSFILDDGTLAMWKSTVAECAPTGPLPAQSAFQDFARWVRDDAYTSPTLVTGEGARKSVAFIQALYESARTGREVTL
ncbi:MAG: Gfo/Idh/MocA family oxidoreductase [Chloroflexi bacterium]|nr:Gfo/Idh/MocA family oxidoreductase [Chloroflexota bacterium]